MIKFMLKAVVLFALVEAFVVQAQTPAYQAPPHFNHIVIIVQENRTPDNLFGAAPSHVSACGTQDEFEPGVDIQAGGPNKASSNHGGPYITCLKPEPDLLNGGGDHSHQNPTDPNAGWVAQCDQDSNGHCQMDGACLARGSWSYGCPEYQYVTKPVVQPYFDIATNYGFANYMFQTHQGPSFDAHQFLLGGTSAPVFPGDPNNYYQYFVAENPSFYDSGCPVGSPGPAWIDPGGNELGSKVSSECYDHNTLVTYQDLNTGLVHDRGVSWTYYTPDDIGIIWNAPGANPQTCYSAKNGSGPCGGAEWGHVSVAKTDSMKSVPILNDIANCNLSAISWAIPDERWSDHPGFHDNSKGPSYVAAIVDAIGNSTCTDNGQTYWQDTAIFITWDDWGGFYDHVPPPVTYLGTYQGGQWTCTNQNAPNGWGCGYVYGFRVPLLVVSAYTPPHTISGPISGPPTYPPDPCWTHDFGSILAFTENNFGLPPIAQPGPPQYTYADQNSRDAFCQHRQVVPLWDFFLGPYRNFTPILPTDPSYDANYFMNYYQANKATPIGPEDGDPND